MDKEALYWYWLCNINGIGIAKRHYLLKQFQTPRAVFIAKQERLQACEKLSQENIVSILKSKDIKKIEKEYTKMQQKDIAFLYPEHSLYPETLKELSDYPIGLYCRGNIPERAAPTVAVVGARACSEYGRWIAYELAKEFAQMGIVVISGMAAGIDTAAHLGALDGGGITYAVFGCGIDICYPRSNIELCMRIKEAGTLLSEYPCGVQPFSGLFPQRNRIISGLADAVVVVEARKRSGSLITVDQALEQNKDVFVVPGRIGDALSEGCLALIRQGASIITEANDILENANIKQKMELFSTNQDKKIIKNGKNEKNKLASEKDMVYSCLNLYPKNIDMIIKETGLSVADMSHVLLELQLEGQIQEVTKNMYIKSPG